MSKVKSLDDYSGYGNEVLYEMVQKAPNHTDLDEIHAKLWIIGRSYAASIERRKGATTKKGVDFIKKKAAPAVLNSDIDKWIESVTKIERLSSDNIELSLECHKKLTDLFCKISRNNMRSLASKYLHFHQPNAFFIYDSRANGKIREKLSKYKKKIRHTIYNGKGYDDDYASFVSRCLYYRDNYLEKRLKGKVTPRRLDKELLGY